jgi:hypothetical protein
MGMVGALSPGVHQVITFNGLIADDTALQPGIPETRFVINTLIVFGVYAVDGFSADGATQLDFFFKTGGVVLLPIGQNPWAINGITANSADMLLAAIIRRSGKAGVKKKKRKNNSYGCYLFKGMEGHGPTSRKGECFKPL